MSKNHSHRSQVVHDIQQGIRSCVKKLPGWIKTPVRRKAVVYSGDFENNAGDIEIINYKNLRF